MYLNKLYDYRFLLYELVKKGIKLKYRRSYLGIIWSLLEPILTTIVLVIVFGTLFHADDKTFPLYIITGRIFYGFFSTGTNGASRSIKANASMIKKVYVPKLMYPLADVLFNFIISSISLTVLVGVQLYCGVPLTYHVFQLIPALLLILLFTFGVGLIITTMNVFFHDIEYLWNIVLMVIMYASAIFYYPEAILKSKFYWIIKFNPVYQAIKMGRDAVMGNAFDAGGAYILITWCIVSLICGIVFFKRKQEKFIHYI